MTGGTESVTFAQFTNFMVSITEDKATPEQVLDSFRAVAGSKVLKIAFIRIEPFSVGLHHQK